MNELMRRGGVLTLLRGRGRHFKRKSTPQPTTPTARQRPGRYPKLQPRSQSLGSLSVITDARSPARYESITNHHQYPLRLTASVHYLGEEIQLFSTPAPPLPPPLPRTHCSPLCLVQDNEPVASCPVPPQPPLVPNLMPHLAVAVVTNTNNNHIYADLELSGKQTQDAVAEEQEEDVDGNSTASGGMDEVVTCQQVHIEVNCSSSSTPDAAQSSIDAHLDRIDELNRVLDDRLKRSLQPQAPLLANGLNAIESCVEDRTELDAECQDKRNSSNSSSQLSTGQAKKRSLSFTQKSISNLLTNIKEFSKSPLTRVVKNVALNEESDREAPHNNNNNQQGSSTATTSIATTITATSASTTTTTTTATTPSKESNSRLKFKVPKIQKKSKAIRNTFRTKLLNFQLRHSKTLCKQCTKRRRIHPSKSSFDLAKDFTETTDLQLQQQQEGDQQFCNCPVAAPVKTKTVQMPRSCDDDHEDDDEGDGDNSSSDDVLSLKDHCYCVPSLAASVSSSSSASGSRSADRDRVTDPTEIDKEEERAHPATASK